MNNLNSPAIVSGNVYERTVMDNLENLSKTETRKLWQKYLKKPVPRLKKSTLIKHILWHQQAKENKIALRPYYALLEKTTREFESDATLKNDEVFEVGARLIRSYKGNRYEVEVIKDGFLFEGVVYKTLTGIAKKITGVHWNGKRFFRGEHGTRKKDS